jgi:hypothetical protein
MGGASLGKVLDISPMKLCFSHTCTDITLDQLLDVKSVASIGKLIRIDKDLRLS